MLLVLTRLIQKCYDNSACINNKKNRLKSHNIFSYRRACEFFFYKIRLLNEKRLYLGNSPSFQTTHWKIGVVTQSQLSRAQKVIRIAENAIVLTNIHIIFCFTRKTYILQTKRKFEARSLEKTINS